jgi:GTP cyclohydrolase I
MADITPIKRASKLLPDVSDEKKSLIVGNINKVGMEKIEMPVLYRYENGQEALLPASVNAYVSLDKADAKGIHMSRLYLTLEQELTKKPFSTSLVAEVLRKFLSGHKDLSEKSFLEISFQLPVPRTALVSGQPGWRMYDVRFCGENEQGQLSFVTEIEVAYSSTCPCSAALSRQLNSESFYHQFIDRESLSVEEVAEWLMKEQSMAATPHAQRSHAKVKVKHSNANLTIAFTELIDLVEEALKTPVQSAVKRSDEQEFARLNASNLMFCEDAARRIKQALEKDSRFNDYWAHISHVESLHPHDAVSVVSKGVERGW